MTILVTLTADLECGEGDVKFHRFIGTTATVFDELDGLTRADVLKDWIGELEVLYNDALRDWAVETEPYRRKHDSESCELCKEQSND